MPYSNPEEYTAYQRQYRADNRARIAAQQAEYRAANADAFRAKDRARGQRPGHAAACARYAAANPAKVRAAAAAHRAARPDLHRARNERARARNNAKLADLKSAPCTDCGCCYPPPVMEHDHVRGAKLYNINASVMGRKDLADELAKCELRCANCHRLRHHNERTPA